MPYHAVSEALVARAMRFSAVTEGPSLRACSRRDPERASSTSTRSASRLGAHGSLRLLAGEHGEDVLGGEGRHFVAGLDGGTADVRGEDGVLELE
jgi:hypothetical protein